MAFLRTGDGGSGSSGSVSVTANGVKTWNTLLTELAALVDTSKISSKTSHIYRNGVVYDIVNVQNLQFTNIYVSNGSYVSVGTIALAATKVFMLATLQTSGNTFSNKLNEVPTSGDGLTLYY